MYTDLDKSSSEPLKVYDLDKSNTSPLKDQVRTIESANYNDETDNDRRDYKTLKELEEEKERARQVAAENEALKKELDRTRKEKERLEKEKIAKEKEVVTAATAPKNDKEYKELAQSFEQSEELRNIYKSLA